MVMAGLNSSSASDTMTFAFTAPVSAVGGFINYNPGPNTTTPTIAVYDTLGQLIENATLSFNTGGGLNSGFFYGFQETTANIGSFTLTGNYIGITNLTTSTAVVSTPEPASIALLASGILGFAATRRKKKLVA
jgi:hypothetical protein